MKKGIIFDLDGTLLNTISDLNLAINMTYEELKIPKRDSVSTTMARVGNGIYNLIEQCFDKQNDLVNKAYDIFLKKYDEVYDKTSEPYKGINELINKLIKDNLKIAVNSNKNDIYTKKLIEHHFPQIDLNLVLGHKDNMKVKPDPTGANLLIKEMQLDKKDVLYIGDSLTDIKTANNAGIDCLSVTWGFRKKKELEKYNKNLIDKPKDIYNFL